MALGTHHEGQHQAFERAEWSKGGRDTLLLQRSFQSLTGSLSSGNFLAELLLLLFVITARYLRGCLQRIEKASDKLLIDLKGARAAETRCSHSALM